MLSTELSTDPSTDAATGRPSDLDGGLTAAVAELASDNSTDTDLPLILLPSRVPFEAIFAAGPRPSSGLSGAAGGQGVSPADLLGPLCDAAREASDQQADVREHVLVAVHSLLASCGGSKSLDQVRGRGRGWESERASE